MCVFTAFIKGPEQCLSYNRSSINVCVTCLVFDLEYSQVSCEAFLLFLTSIICLYIFTFAEVAKFCDLHICGHIIFCIVKSVFSVHTQYPYFMYIYTHAAIDAHVVRTCKNRTLEEEIINLLQ